MKKILTWILIFFCFWMGETFIYANSPSSDFMLSSQLTSSVSRAALLAQKKQRKEKTNVLFSVEIPEEIFLDILFYFSERHSENTVVDNFGEIYTQGVVENKVLVKEIHGYYFRVMDSLKYYYYYVEIHFDQEKKPRLLPIEFLNMEYIEEGLEGDAFYNHMLFLTSTFFKESYTVFGEKDLPRNALKTFAEIFPLSRLVFINNVEPLRNYTQLKSPKVEISEVNIEYILRDGKTQSETFRILTSVYSDKTKNYYLHSDFSW